MVVPSPRTLVHTLDHSDWRVLLAIKVCPCPCIGYVQYELAPMGDSGSLKVKRESENLVKF